MLQGMLTGTSQMSKHLHPGGKTSAPCCAINKLTFPPGGGTFGPARPAQVLAVSKGCGGTLGCCWKAQHCVQAGGTIAWSQSPRPSQSGEAWTSSSNLGKNLSSESSDFSCPLGKGMKSLWSGPQQNCL